MTIRVLSPLDTTSTGATAGGGFAGETVSGAPVTGTYALGQHVVAQNGHVWVCTAAGAPGTWTDASKNYELRTNARSLFR